MFKQFADQAKLIYDLFMNNEKVLLIVLDACNWRVISAIKSEWKTEIVSSRGSNTSDWLLKTFTKTLDDVVYVSANPFAHAIKPVREKFKRVVDLSRICWDGKLQTVKPSPVNFFVKETIASGEGKIIAHYLQPHAPFLTESWLNNYSYQFDFKDEFRTPEIYNLSRKRRDARREFRRAYVENLKVVVKYVEFLAAFAKDLDSEFKTVITSDHSEILKGVYHPLRDKKRFWLWIGWVLGIYRFVGHEHKSRFKRLYEVPWILL